MSSLKVALIIDQGQVQRFGLRAIDSLAGCDEITVFSCRNTRISRKPVRHGAYYALNLLTVRNRETSVVSVTQTRKRIAELIEFDSGYDGAWQTLPPNVIEDLAGFDVIVKLGMGLLRVPTSDMLPVPILAWHHGDPDHYRGRPAGFWEMADKAPMIGQIIQILSNKLDGGRVVAFAQTKVFPYSYRATLIEAYRHSHLLLNQAIRNALRGDALPISSDGKNYRLPSNMTVIRFVARMAAAFVKRICYGAFIEKKWHVSEAEIGPGGQEAIAAASAFPTVEDWRMVPTPRGYVFLADPFFSQDPPGLLVEALSRKTSLGEILLVTNGGHQRLSAASHHFSYPGTVEAAGERFLVPEMAQAGVQRFFRIRGGHMEDAGTLDVEGSPAILDPTLIEHERRLYLFGNSRDQGSSALMLWSAESITGRFNLHPCSPVLITPAGGRMAGSLAKIDGRLIRFGQSFLDDYGDGVFAFEVEALTPDIYRERPLGCIQFKDRQGPHTLNFAGAHMVFDWYVRRVSPFAGIRRLAARLN